MYINYTPKGSISMAKGQLKAADGGCYPDPEEAILGIGFTEQ